MRRLINLIKNNRYADTGVLIPDPNDLPKLPKFIITGVMKCGTTALANFLANHPDVIHSQKEPREG